MKKILIINHASTIGGAGKSLLDMVSNIDKSQFDIIVYSNNNSTEINEILESMFIKVIRSYNSPLSFAHFSGSSFPFYSKSFLMNFLRVFRDSIKLKKIVVSINPDILIVNSMTLFWVGIISRNVNCRKICFFRETFVRGFIGFRTFIIRKTLDYFFDDVVFISNYDRKLANLKKANSHIIYDKVDSLKFDFSKKNNRNIDTFNILFLGGSTYLKGGHILLEALNYLEIKNYRLIIPISEFNKQNLLHERNKDTNKLKYILKKDDSYFFSKAYSQLKNKENIEFVPNVNEVEKYYEVANLVVFPAVSAHQTRLIYESGFAKRLILISDYPNIKEFLIDEINGFTFKSGDSKMLANKIDYIFSHINTKFIHSIIDNNFERSKKNHSICTLKMELQNLLNEKQ